MSVSEFPPALESRLVLIMEDDAVLLKAIAGWFLTAGCTIMTAPDGAVGLKKFEQIRPDLVIADIIMPEREGVETIMAMKSRDATVPILAISGGGRIGSSQFLSLALGLGANAALAKPFRSREILAAASELLDQAPKAA